MGDETLTWQAFALTCQFSTAKVMMEMGYCYTTVYGLLPKYFLKEKYIHFGLALLSISILHNVFFLTFLNWIVPGAIQDLSQIVQTVITNFVMTGPFAICILLIAYKMLKIWHQKEQEKTELIIENTSAELRLLKAQVHPHFLFNTLNNIYSYALDRSARAGDLVAKLSHILFYMTQATDRIDVALDQELKMLRDYIALERVRYNNRLTLQVEITGDLHLKRIPPLLLIPFIENSFKHGPSKMIQDSWIRLMINIEEDRLSFDLSNSRPDNSQITNGKNGLGLRNVKRRLELLYPKTHSLVIISKEHQFHVHLNIGLTKDLSPLEFTSPLHAAPTRLNSTSYV